MYPNKIIVTKSHNLIYNLCIVENFKVALKFDT